MRHGARLGLDVGTVRVGVAKCDPSGLLATPVETIQRSIGDAAVVARVLALVEEYDAIECVVGLPISMRGTDTASTLDARNVAELIANHVPTRLVDERLSTVSATSALRASGRSSKSGRSVIDQAAAVVILQHAIESERSRGTAPGVLLETEED
ncbi:Holliday junction resolvase RuvX [Humidisolicoccus flavus]|uniref:Holliday junction resolvase RuvX n=1 Tax=Humidisolicoccus flavus TaxID=3111414 RepID=UPI003252E46A